MSNEAALKFHETTLDARFRDGEQFAAALDRSVASAVARFPDSLSLEKVFSKSTFEKDIDTAMNALYSYADDGFSNEQLRLQAIRILQRDHVKRRMKLEGVGFDEQDQEDMDDLECRLARVVA